MIRKSAPLALCLIALAIPTAATAAGGPRAAVVDTFVLPPRLDYARADLLRAAVEIAEKRNWAPVIAAGEPCRDRACVPRIASETKADYVLVLRGQYVTTGKYADLAVDLWHDGAIIRSAAEESGTADRRVTDGSSCSADLGCTITDVTARIRQFAAKVVDEENAAREARSKIAVAPAPAMPAILTNPPVTSTPEPPTNRRKAVGVALLAGAGAGLITGGVLWYLDGRDVGCASLPDGEVCDRSRTSRTASIVALSAGAALGVAGGILLYRSRSGATARLDVVSNGLALAGAF